jgi:ribosomal protein S12 methylthiotransferase accessory factor
LRQPLQLDLIEPARTLVPLLTGLMLAPVPVAKGAKRSSFCSMTNKLWQRVCDDSSTPRYHFGTWRSTNPTETLRRITPLLGLAGITRLADITGLDPIAVPVFQAVRPNSRNISLSIGKGLTRDQAKVSALMEAFETHHAEEVSQPTVRATLGSMRRELGYDPYSLAVVRSTIGCARRDIDYDPFMPPTGRPGFLSDQTPVDWVSATDLSTGACTWVPKQLCELNFCVEERLCMPLFRASSNGLASGNSVVEALVHGLCEVVERDCVWRNDSAWADQERCIAPATVNSPAAQRLLRRFAQTRLKTQIVDLTGPTGLACFEVYLSDPDCAAYKGFGCHPCRHTALLRALTEAAQSRLAHIAGTRDDLYRETYRNALHLPRPRESAVFALEPHRTFQSCPDQVMGPWTMVLEEIVRRVRTMTGVSPLAVDLMRPEFGIPVVSVVAPGLGFRPPQRR